MRTSAEFAIKVHGLLDGAVRYLNSYYYKTLMTNCSRDATAEPSFSLSDFSIALMFLAVLAADYAPYYVCIEMLNTNDRCTIKSVSFLTQRKYESM